MDREKTKFRRLKGAQSGVLEFATPVLESAPTYPHAYFTAHPGKPPVTIPTNSKAALQFVTDQIHAAITSGSEIPATYVTAFLYEHLIQFPTVKLDTDWTSYKVKIGKAGEDIGPMSLLAKEDGPDIQIQASSGTPRWEDIFFRLAMTYRMRKARDSPDPSYINNLNTKLTALEKTCPWKVTVTGSVDTSRLDGILEDAQVKCLIAALDMFLFKLRITRTVFSEQEL
jgi:hypothetical protein